ncbi:hypothetical protein JCGZ_18128 [Jatropha curcas]|uniref:Aminotransferase-like plant mobile domain-containing protein n=1 Tax=Jatropha curcas TaxID=180498 RepID=A0A067K517_JATCU|nr:hypothetical protein JCGZ_18128 [Jatropha curcas]
MAHLPEIPASAYTPEMDTLGAILDIPVFEGERVPMSRNALTPGTRPLQLLPLPGSDFLVQHDTDAMRRFLSELRDAAVLASSCVTQLFWCEQLRDATVRSYATPLSLDFDFASLVCLDVLLAILNCDALSITTCLGPVDLGKARAGRSLTDASAFWDLLDPPMRSRVVTAGFGDYAAGLHRTQPWFPPAMRYVLMEWWNDCTHAFIFGFGEMTLTPTDYTAITGLGFDGDVAPLDSQYQTATLGAELVRTLLGVPTCTRYTAQGYVSYEVVYKFWAERIRTRWAAWRELPADARPAALAYTREERDQAARSFIFYIISSQLLCTSQNKGDPAVLACLRDLSVVGSYDWASLALAHLYHGLDMWAYEYRIYPGGPESDTSAEARWIPRYLTHRHHTFSNSEDPHYWRCYLNDRALADLLLTPWEGDAWAAYPPRALAEALTRSRVLL